MTRSERIEEQRVVQRQITKRTTASPWGEARSQDSVVPERSCLVCRTARPTSELLRVSVLEGRLVFDRQQKRSGRSTYVCLASDCFYGINSNRLSRAFRTNESLVESIDESVSRLAMIANKRIFESLGLARRSGKVELGTDRVAENLRSCMDHGRSGVALRSTDLAVRTINRLNDAWPVGTSEELGRAIGVGKAGAVWVSASRFVFALEFWLQVKRAASVDKSPDRMSDGSKKGKS